MDFAYLFASTAGRISGRDCWIGIFAILVISLVVVMLILWFFGEAPSAGFRFALFIFLLAIAYPVYALLGKRFQDRNKPNNFALVGVGLSLLSALLYFLGITDPFAPAALDWIFNIAFIIVGIWFLIELGFLRGTVGPNTFGPDPLEAPAAR